MGNDQEKVVTTRTEWEQPKLNKLSLKDALANTASGGDAYSLAS